MTQKKSKFWTFLFSFIPGAGEMYMGFMKMGLSLMGMFMLIIAVSTLLEFGALMFVAAIAWFYSFFHVHNVASLPDEEFYALEDNYLFNFIESEQQGKALIQTYRQVIAIALIVVGVVMSWQGFFRMLSQYIPESLYYIIRDIGYRIPQIVVGLAIIVLGVKMISGKKQQLDTATEDDAAAPAGKEQ